MIPTLELLNFKLSKVTAMYPPPKPKRKPTFKDGESYRLSEKWKNQQERDKRTVPGKRKNNRKKPKKR